MQHKSIFELLASATEELGEFSRELKIEAGTYGNGHKKPDEGTISEAVDMAICALALFYAQGGTNEQLYILMNKKLDKWEACQNG